MNNHHNTGGAGFSGGFDGGQQQQQAQLDQQQQSQQQQQQQQPQHAFLQQDPFAFQSAHSRTRTLSSGGSSSGGSHHHQHQQQQQHQSQPSQHSHTGSLSANGIWADQPAAQQPQQLHMDGFNGGNQNSRSATFPQNATGFPQPPSHQQQQQPYNGGRQNGISTPQAAQDASADDIIPTAIVIKNIPFNFPSESLLAIIEELTLAPPYAFNYHYDMRVFRGLAFANFHTPQETDACVAALNGFEIQGRKLRVEYKKVLQAGEKERIERDKAIKRMRSMQFERERMIAQQQAHALHLQQHMFNSGVPPLPLQHQQQQHPMPVHPQMQLRQQHQPSHDEPEDYGRAVHPSNSIFNRNINNSGQLAFSPPMDGAYPSHSNSSSGGASTSSRTGSGTSMPSEIDMNDQQTLELYSRILLFKEDALRDELAFAKALSPVQRRIVHLIAQKLNLDHRSAGSGDERYVIVSKTSTNGLSLTSQQQQRSLRTRASAYPMLNPDPYAPPQPSMLGDAMAMHGFSSALRKKSMPDLRHQQQHPLYGIPDYQQHSSQQQQRHAGHAQQTQQINGSGFVTGTSSASHHSNVTPRHSTHDLRAVAASATNRRSLHMHTSAPGEGVPPVPAVPLNLAFQQQQQQQSLQHINGISTSLPTSAPPADNSRHSFIFGSHAGSGSISGSASGSGSLDLSHGSNDVMPKTASSLPTSTLSMDSKIVGSPVNSNAASNGNVAGAVVRQPRGPDSASSWARAAAIAAATAASS